MQGWTELTETEMWDNFYVKACFFFFLPLSICQHQQLQMGQV